MKKRLAVIAMLLLLALLVLTGCTSDGSDPQPTAAPQPAAAITEAAPATDTAAEAANTTQTEEVRMTIQELAQFDGKNGNPAYIAVDGVIYDVTNVSLWKGGYHNGFTAGQNLTEEIKNISPHGISKLNGLTVVGKLAE